MSELQEELSLRSALDEERDDLEVARRAARGEDGGGRRTTLTTLWVCSQMRRKRRMLPKYSTLANILNHYKPFYYLIAG